MKNKNIIFSLLVVVSFIIGIKPATASELNFSAIPTIPENQLDKEKTYFDLLMQPKTTQVVEIKLQNDTDKEVIVEPIIHSATTNTNGVVEYGKVKEQQDSTLLYNLKDLISVAKDVTIPAKSEVILPLTIKMPEKNFPGVLAGGITLQEKEKEQSEESAKKEGLAIENRYAYVIGIVLRLSEEKVEPNMLLRKVEPSQVNARNVIQANLQNSAPSFINQLSVKAEITRKNSSEVIFSQNKEGMQMAPNSNFNFPISLNGKKLEAGQYTFKATALSKGKEWKFEKDFKIDSKIAKNLNASDVSIEKDYTWIYILIASVLIFSIQAIFILVLKLRKKKKAAK